MMSPEQFFELMLKDLELHSEMQPYYKFLGEPSSWHFRKNYFLQRLRYINEQVVASSNSPSGIVVAVMAPPVSFSRSMAYERTVLHWSFITKPYRNVWNTGSNSAIYRYLLSATKTFLIAHHQPIPTISL